MPVPVHELALPTIEQTPLPGRVDGLAALDRLRAAHWLARSPFGYVLTRHDDCVAVLKDGRWHQAVRLLAALNGVTDERYLARQNRPSILSAEGDEHQRLRRLVSPAFTPRSADRLRPVMRTVIGEILDAAVGAAPPGTVVRLDFARDVCRPYPIPIICELLGAPKEDWALFSRWADSIFQVFNADIAAHTDEVMDAFDEMDAYVRALIAPRRTDRRDDLLSDLVDAEEAGDRLSTDELVMLASSVLLAGTDTTRNQLACALAVFAEHRDQWDLLRARPELAARATEESFRYLGAVRRTGRFASVDITYRDVLFPAGTLVFPSFVGANHDPERFADPHTFDITAERSVGHLTLGFGLHYCLGANLARAELQEALVVLATRMPDVRLDGDVVWKPDTVGIWGPAHLPLAFTVGG